MWWSNGFHHEQEVVGSIPVAGLEIDVKLRNLKIRVYFLGVGWGLFETLLYIVDTSLSQLVGICEDSTMPSLLQGLNL